MKRVIIFLLFIIRVGRGGRAGRYPAHPWMDRWGATEAEINASLAGDELVPEPASTLTRAVTIDAAPEQIYPWLVQLGAGRGGYYSYTWLEPTCSAARW